MKIKKILLSLLALCLILSIVGCGKKSTGNEGDTSADAQTQEDTKDGDEDNESGEEDVVLRIAWWGSQARHDATVEVIEMYIKDNPHVDIQYEFYDFDGYFTKLNTLVASNDVWDMFQLGGNFPTYLDKIDPLDKYIDSGLIDISDTTEAFLQTTQNDGEQIGISNGVNTYGVAYDPAMFAEAGVAEPSIDWTWQDYYDACIKIHEELGIYGSSKFDDFIGGASMGISQEDFALNFFAVSNDKLGFDDYTMLTDYIQMRADLTEAGAYPDPGAIAEIKDIEGDYIVTGEAAMTWVASNQFLALSEAAGKELKLAPAPRKKTDGPSGSTIQSSQMFCISKDSKHPEEAAKFLNYFWTNIDANLVLAGERGNTIFSSVREAQEEGLTKEQLVVSSFVDLIGSFETGEINVISPEPKTEIEDYYNLTVQKVIYGELTADEAAKEIYDFAKGKFE